MQVEALANSEATALASLAITESLMLSLKETGILSEEETNGLLEDAREAHLNAVATAENPEVHREAAEQIEAIRQGVDGTRRHRRSD